MSEKRLYLSRDKMIAGVAGGIGEYFDVDPTLIRLIFVLTSVGGVGIVLYIAGMILIPERPIYKSEPTTETEQEAIDDLKKAAKSLAEAGGEAAQDVAETIRHSIDRLRNPQSTVETHEHGDSGKTLGIILIIVGGLLLVKILLPTLRWNIVLPIALIVAGVGLIIRGFGEDK